MTVETINWVAVTDRLPDDGMTVLVAFELDDPWLGWLEDGQWFDVTAAPIEGVTYWADAPMGPAQ